MKLLTDGLLLSLAGMSMSMKTEPLFLPVHLLSTQLSAQSPPPNTTTSASRTRIPSTRGISGKATREESASTRVTKLGLATLLEPLRRSHDSPVVRGINTKPVPTEQAGFNRGSQHHVVEVRIRIRRFLQENGVLGVFHLGLPICVVRGELRNRVDQILVEEELARVGGLEIPYGVVGFWGGAQVGHDVDVRGAAGVVAGEICLELDNAVGIRLLGAAQERPV